MPQREGSQIENQHKRAGEWPLSRVAILAYLGGFLFWLLGLIFLDGGMSR